MTVARRLFLVLGIVLLAAVPAAVAGAPRFASIDYPGATDTLAYGINPAGDIVGGYYDSSGNEHGFVLHAGNFVRFDYPDATWTEGWGITPGGDIVGQYGLPDNTVHGFLLRAGNFFPVEVPDQASNLGAPNTMVVKISPTGEIVGCYHQSKSSGAVIAGTMYGFAVTADGITSFPQAGSMHNGVNPSGAITGNATDPVSGVMRESYVISEGVTTYFSFPDALVTRAWDIGPTGDVVGWYKDAAGHWHGFLRRNNGTMTSVDADFAGVTQTRPYGINAAGEIVGYYQDSTGYHGFLFSRRGAE
jgi:uncharacterized membrane protein